LSKRIISDTMVYLLLLIVMLFWGSNFVVLKFGLKQLSPQAFTALRFLIAGPLMVLIALFLKVDLRIKKCDYIRILILGVVYTAFYQTLFAAAVNSTTAGNSSLIMTTSPLFAALMSYAMGYERFTRKAAYGSILSFLGVCLVLRSSYAVGISTSTLKGDVLALSASVLWASYAIYIKVLMVRYHYLHLMVYSSIIGGTVLAIYSWSDIQMFLSSGVSSATTWSLTYSIFGVSVYGLTMWYYGIDRLGPAKTYVFMHLNPIIAMTVGALMLNEALTVPKIIGLCMTLVGIDIARKNINKMPERLKEPAPVSST
jgi:drug/metabolite transporter (DMT)-like permease